VSFFIQALVSPSRNHANPPLVQEIRNLTPQRGRSLNYSSQNTAIVRNRRPPGRSRYILFLSPLLSLASVPQTTVRHHLPLPWSPAQAFCWSARGKERASELVRTQASPRQQSPSITPPVMGFSIFCVVRLIGETFPPLMRFSTSSPKATGKDCLFLC